MKRMNIKKYIALALAVCAVMTSASCGRKDDDANHADKLVKGKVSAKANISPDAKDMSKEPVPDSDNENISDEMTGEENAAEEQTEMHSGSAELEKYGFSSDDLSAVVDNTARAYQSVSLQPIGTPDFFKDKTLRLAFTVYNNEMTSQYEMGIDNVFTDDLYSISVGDMEESYKVYAASDSVNITPDGNQYSYVVYGMDDMDVTAGIMTRIKISDDVDTDEAAAEDYIMLISASGGMMYIFKAE